MPSVAKKLLWLAAGVLLVGVIYHFYPYALFKVTEWQRSFNVQLSASLNAINQNRQQAGFSLLLISFLYGIFHAVGPGHGKFILTSYLALEQAKLRQAVSLSLWSALVQGLVAVGLVSVIVVLLTLSRSYFNTTLQWIERGSFALMIAFGLYWGGLALKQLKSRQSLPKLQKIRAMTPAETPFRAVAMPHRHSEQCGCGHQHLPSGAQMQQAHSWQARLLIILSIGCRPCTGAILVLFLAYTLDLYAWGVLSAFAMAIGTGLTLSLFAWLVLFARHRAIGLSQWYVSRANRPQFALYLKFTAAAILIAFGVMLLHSSLLESSANLLFKR